MTDASQQPRDEAQRQPHATNSTPRDRRPERASAGSTADLTHACPPDGSGTTPCCGRTPFEIAGDRMTTESSLVTCGTTRDTEQPAYAWAQTVDTTERDRLASWLYLHCTTVANGLIKDDPRTIAHHALMWTDGAYVDDAPTMGDADTCRPVEIDGEIIRVHGSGEMSDESRAALAEIIRAAKRRFAAEQGAPRAAVDTAHRYCILCGGQVQPGHTCDPAGLRRVYGDLMERAENARERADRLAGTLREVLDCKHNISQQDIDRWRAVLDQPAPAADTTTKD